MSDFKINTSFFVPTVGQKCLGTSCPQKRGNSRPCRGKLCDFVLDWEAELPDDDLDLSNAHSTLADLSIVIGSTLQVSFRR
jgi:mono-ADP-ribosyltransferase sirtuin 6